MAIKKEDFLKDMLDVFSVTNQEGFKFYVTEIENNPENAEVLLHLKKFLRDMLFGKFKKVKPEYKQAMIDYFQMLYDGYSVFPKVYMKDQNTELNRDVLLSMVCLLDTLSETSYESFMTQHDQEIEFELLIQKIGENKPLDDDLYERVKQLAEWVCVRQKTKVEQFLKKYQPQHCLQLN